MRKESRIHPLRRGRHSSANAAYLVTWVTANRRPLFASFELGCVASRLLADPVTWPDAKLLAWVLMPDHAHILVQLGVRESLDLVVQRAKGRTSRALRAQIGSVPIWQPRFHDHGLRNHESLRAAARYLVANPLRARLVDRIGDYPFWDCIWLDAALAP